ncbi:MULTISPECIES: RNA 2',3'-cyclic phosphodiesterase [Niallia]|jgi:RNA 2',3'-cyclic 3'-phosphodiesterase|uniref:RNA 2',3'-cyclic phosphodiesterase n=1 Tax=Niallia circulans TaxID=1397 RepID=A0AA91TPH4_NIACI|nr:RNA 2',3'-cyclic phosphodiesterase [Niallia circulans]PAD81763.1 RNA 2',3'-cyclic phosphodiesterase [Niallia circulans]QJX63466.1 RNA 2',3'-cyclic phosphodiesterase [Niallia circulans]
MKTTIPHYFIGIKPDVQVINEIEKIQKELQLKFPFKKWVHPLDYHITLAFLGNASDEQKKKLHVLLNQSSPLSTNFQIHIDHLGVFGQRQNPRIFWAGMKEEQKLVELRNQVFAVSSKAGFQLETRPFHPHLTLARKWKEDTIFSERELNEFSMPKNFISNVDSIHLFQTHMDKIPKYEIINSYSFHNYKQ